MDAVVTPKQIPTKLQQNNKNNIYRHTYIANKVINET